MEHFEDVHMLLALCYRYKGMYDKALEQFEQVKKQNTQYPLIDMYIGSSYAKLGKIEQALEVAWLWKESIAFATSFGAAR